MTIQSQGKFILMIGVVIIVAIIGFYVLNAPDRRDGAERLGDAINALPDGVDKAARQLEKRTPAEKLEDAAKDTGNDIKNSINQQ